MSLRNLSNYFDDLNQMRAQAHPEQLIIEAAFFRIGGHDQKSASQYIYQNS